MTALSTNSKNITNQLNSGPQGQHENKKERFDFNAFTKEKQVFNLTLKKTFKKEVTNRRIGNLKTAFSSHLAQTLLNRI